MSPPPSWTPVDRGPTGTITTCIRDCGPDGEKVTLLIAFPESNGSKFNVVIWPLDTVLPLNASHWMTIKPPSSSEDPDLAEFHRMLRSVADPEPVFMWRAACAYARKGKP